MTNCFRSCRFVRKKALCDIIPGDMLYAHTLQQPFVVEGTGLHTGAAARVHVHPATAPRGRVFLRNGVEIPALTNFVTDTRRCTTLGHNGQTISTVEHLLAALLLANVDHAEILVEGPELPALDGSARYWYESICQAGVCPLHVEIPTVSISQAQWVHDDGSEFFLFPADGLQAYAGLSIPETIAERMLAGGAVADPAICAQIVRARTFGLEREVAALFAAGLARGGSLDNAVILTQDGYLNDSVWPQEPAWHKVLDLLGDLALVGARIRGQILAVRAGHRSHVALAKNLRQSL